MNTYKLTLSQLKIPGVKILKSLVAGPKPYDYNKLTYCHFKNSDDYYEFKFNLNLHDILAEIFVGSEILEDEEYTMGWKGLTDKEKIIYGNFANIVFLLKRDIAGLQEEIYALTERLDNI